MDHNDERDFEEERDVRASLEREGREELAEEQRRRPGDTSAARAANVRRGLERKATDLRAAGFLVVTPEEIEKLPRDKYGCLMMQVDWPASGVERHEFTS